MIKNKVRTIKLSGQEANSVIGALLGLKHSGGPWDSVLQHALEVIRSSPEEEVTDSGGAKSSELVE